MHTWAEDPPTSTPLTSIHTAGPHWAQLARRGDCDGQEGRAGGRGRAATYEEPSIYCDPATSTCLHSCHILWSVGSCGVYHPCAHARDGSAGLTGNAVCSVGHGHCSSLGEASSLCQSLCLHFTPPLLSRLLCALVLTRIWLVVEQPSTGLMYQCPSWCTSCTCPRRDLHRPFRLASKQPTTGCCNVAIIKCMHVH
jgi:hypothetical protein